MADDFSRRPGRGWFPTTRRSAVAAVGSDDPAERARSFEILVHAYWKPVYTHIRVTRRIPPAEAEDLTQGFFAHALEKGIFQAYDPGRARFRTYVRVCADSYVVAETRARHRLKRNFRPPAERDDRATLFREPPKHRARLSRDVEIVG